MTRAVIIAALFLLSGTASAGSYENHIERGLIFLEADGGGKDALREFRKARKDKNTAEVKALIAKAKEKKREWR